MQDFIIFAISTTWATAVVVCAYIYGKINGERTQAHMYAEFASSISQVFRYQPDRIFHVPTKS